MKYLAIKILVVCLCCVGYAANAQSKKKLKTVKDKDGYTYEIKSMPGKLTWITSNLKVNIPDSYVYYNADSNINTYGRLYSWAAAQEGCKQLGNGWRLPTEAEWTKMAKAFGGVADDSKDSGKVAYLELLFDGKSGLNTQWGGRRDANAQYYHNKLRGYYWTATETNETQAWVYLFDRMTGTLNRTNDGDKNRYLSVRCVKK
jgi:uncharacterized protein (TIGR02145 family)